MSKPIVALVGRPNVGKSTLFNRIVGRRVAVVHDEPGTTRDRQYAETEWNGVSFLVVDTGGLELLPEAVATGRRPGPDRVLAQDSAPYIPLMRAQAETAIQEADAIIFVTDVATGLTAADEEVAAILRRADCPVFLVPNKVDNPRLEYDALEFYALGLGRLFPVSAIHGRGVADLLDEVVKDLEPSALDREAPGARFAIVGRPNVGKSSLLNTLLGENRVIVSEVPGTTRDAIDTVLTWEDQTVTLIDTAGIRRRGKVERGAEYYSVLRALKAIRRADVALLVIDGYQGVTAQDTHVAGLILDEWTSAMVLINKWDLVDDEAIATAEYTEWVRATLRFLDYAPVLFISALTGQGVNQVLPKAMAVREARFHRIPTSELNRLVQEALARHAPPSKRGKRLKIYYASQPGVDPPTFVFHVNNPDLVHFSYERYLENRLREAYPFPGTPLHLKFKPRRRR